MGMAPSGCTFVTGYNAPDFNESRAFSASSWLATLPKATLAQVRHVGLMVLCMFVPSQSLPVACVQQCSGIACHTG
jgi:hypothetical protein